MKTSFKHTLSGFVIIISLTLAIASTNSSKTVGQNESPVENVTAGKIFSDFKDNEIAAKNKYGNKIISVKGVIASIESYGDGSVIILNDGNPENVGVKCYFNKDQEQDIVSLSMGDIVKVIGIGSESLLIDYDLKNCRLEQVETN